MKVYNIEDIDNFNKTELCEQLLVWANWLSCTKNNYDSMLLLKAITILKDKD